MYDLALPPETLPHNSSHLTLKVFTECQESDGKAIYLVRTNIRLDRTELSLYSYQEKVLQDCLDKGFALVERESYVRFHPNPHLAFFRLQGQQLVLRTDCQPDRALLLKKLANYHERRYWGWEETPEGPLVWVLVTQASRKYTSEVRYGGVQYWWQGEQGTMPISPASVKKLEQKDNVDQAIPSLVLQYLKERTA